MNKKLDILFYMVLPTLAAYTVFFLIFYIYQKLFYEYRWLAVIPFVVDTAVIVKTNIKIWRLINEQH